MSAALDQSAAFATGLAELVLELNRRGYRVVPIEVGVLEQRHSRQGGAFIDGVHKIRSRHYDRAAADLLVYRRVGAEWAQIKDDGSGGRPMDPVWAEIATVWAKLGPEFVTGLGWQDPGHVSVAASDGRK